MAADWFSTFGPHGKPALIGAASGLISGLLLKRLVKSLLMTLAFAAAVYVIVAYTTDWLQGVDLTSAGLNAVEYAKVHKTAAWEAAERFVSTHLASSVGFVAGLLGGLAITGRRLWPRRSSPQQS